MSMITALDVERTPNTLRDEWTLIVHSQTEPRLNIVDPCYIDPPDPIVSKVNGFSGRILDEFVDAYLAARFGSEALDLRYRFAGLRMTVK